jgi:hypothetical protein
MRIRELLSEASGSNYRLVRVVGGLDNIESNGDSTLTVIARYNGSSQRNTLHFTANSVVGDHEMGSFSGKYVIIANPAEMPRDQLAGARAEDTWYRFNDAGELNIGHATILAPEGSSIPNGIKAQYYKGDRAEAIDNAFKQIGIGFRGIAGKDAVPGMNRNEYHKDFSTQYGTGSVTGDFHGNTPEAQLESLPAQLKYQLEKLQKSYIYRNDRGADADVTDRGREFIEIGKRALDKLATESPGAIKSSASYFNYMQKVIDTYEAIFNRADQAYNKQRQEYSAAFKQWKASTKPPAPGQPPPLDPPSEPMAPEWPPKGLDLSIPNIPMAYNKKNK